MAELTHLRKQAKLYLRWHRAGYYPVAAVIRQELPRFQDLSDREILRANFKLADAQELVARRSGYRSWVALLKGAAAVSPSSKNDSSVVMASEPQLFVSDMDAALAFYVGKLGFSLAFAHGQPTFYAQVARDAGRLNLRLAQGPVFDRDFQAREPDVLCATMALDRAKPLFVEYEQAGVDFHQRLRTEPWGARTFIIRDPDGNLIAFAGS